MKICISAYGKDLDSEVDPQFGRCKYFVIVDPKVGLVNAIKNPGSEAPSGAGIRAAEAVVGEGIDILLTGSVGPNSFSILSEAGIETHYGVSGKVAFALHEYQSGKLAVLERPNASTHSGMKNS